MSNDKVVSVSRRSDIPAFFGEWFMNKIKKGYVDSLNPFNPNYVSRISLRKEDVICFVFWSKNPKPFIKYLDELDNLGYKYYFQFTLNPYDNDLEINVPSLDERINTFITLSNRIGKDKVIWRYDPIIINDKYDVSFHIKMFKKMADALSSYTNKVMISFIDLYKKVIRNVKDIEEINEETQKEIGLQFANIARNNQLEVNTCSEKVSLSEFGIKKGKCIDDELIRQIILNDDIILKKDLNQRKECGCIESVDVGVSNTCKHLCLYCYANYSVKTVLNNIKKYDVNSSLLCGKIKEGASIYYRNGPKAKK